MYEEPPDLTSRSYDVRRTQDLTSRLLVHDEPRI